MCLCHWATAPLANTLVGLLPRSRRIELASPCSRTVTDVWFFGRRGPLSDGLRSELSTEGIQVLDESAVAIITYRHYRAPRRRYGHARIRTGVALALTEQRLLVQSRGGSIVDLPWPQARAGSLMTTQDGDSFLVAFEAETFAADRSGHVEVRVRSPQAAAAAAVAQAKLR